MVRVLSRNHPEIDEGWLCDKGRYAFGLLASDRAHHDRASSAAAAGSSRCAPGDALDHVADRLRATVERFGPGSVAVLASGEQTNEEAHAWARLLDEGLGGGDLGVRPRGRRGLGDARALRGVDRRPRRRAGAIVVAGDTDLAHRAPVVELRIRKAVQAGARVVTVGAGGTRLETLRGAHHVSAGARHRARRAPRAPPPDDGELCGRSRRRGGGR